MNYCAVLQQEMKENSTEIEWKLILIHTIYILQKIYNQAIWNYRLFSKYISDLWCVRWTFNAPIFYVFQKYKEHEIERYKENEITTTFFH